MSVPNASMSKLQLFRLELHVSISEITRGALAGLLAAQIAATMPLAGPAPDPVASPHFPDRLHAYIWRNWELVPTRRLAETVGATSEQVVAIGKRMGLPNPPAISDDQWRRSYITIIRRNWHLLPIEQLGRLLGWTPEKLAFTLREDDFLWAKLGSLKPRCKPLAYAAPSKAAAAREKAIARIVHENFPDLDQPAGDPVFGFIRRLSTPSADAAPVAEKSRYSPRFCYSYFALYGDPLLEIETDSFPDGYLARLARSGVDGVWLQAVLYKLTPFPWDTKLSEHYQERLERLSELVTLARRYGLGVYLYFNEPRAMPISFFKQHPDLQGCIEGEYAALCTSVPTVQTYLRDGVAAICKRVPDLAGIFTITASENLTNCWSHSHGQNCPRCARRRPDEVIPEVNAIFAEGIAKAGKVRTRLIAWDWGWDDSWTPAAIKRLPREASLMSVSEWGLPIERDGIKSQVGEYSISAIGPGSRATQHWALAREQGMGTIAKIQANNTWEFSVVPYIPAVENVARHVAGLRSAGVEGLMLSWTLGGYPSPNLEVAAELGRQEVLSPEEAMLKVARRRYGAALAPAIVAAWHTCSTIFQEFPFHIGVLYRAPQQMGPANPLWERPTGFKATMTGFPYDDLDDWRGIYPVDVFIRQFNIMAAGFADAATSLRKAGQNVGLNENYSRMLDGELNVIDTCAIHFRSVADQGLFVQARNELAAALSRDEARRACAKIEEILNTEIDLARRMYRIQRWDSRIGFEAANHYFFVPLDLVEKVINCRDLLTRWLPAERARHGL
jgi:hypothetical protein